MRVIATAVVLTALLVAGAAKAQETISEIEVRGLSSLAEETVLYYLGLERGGVLDPADLDERIRKLWERKLIDDVRVEREAAADGGLKLVVTLQERPILRSLEYEGLKGISRTDVNDRLAREQIDVREGEPLDLGELSRLRATLESMYQDKGFRFAEAKYRIEDVGIGERRVVFLVEENEKVRVGKIDFVGNTVISDRRLRWKMEKTKETSLYHRLFKKDIYNPAGIEEDLQSIRDLYRAIGYKAVFVDDPDLSVLRKGDQRRLGVSIPIDEGTRWKLGEIRIEGNEFFTDEGVRARFKKPRGGWLRMKALDEGVEAVTELYKNTGHIMADVRTRVVETGDDVADFVVEIDEGDQFRVGRLEFAGNTRTRDKVLRREFRVQEGTLLNMGGVKSSLFKINQLNYFKLDEDDPVSFENFDTENKTVDLLVHGQEADRTELQVGGGWSEAYGFFGQVSIKTQNFLGRGETVGLSIQSGRYSDQYDLSYFIPWFRDRPQSVGVQLFNTQVDYTQLLDLENKQDSKGVVLTYGRSFGYFNSLSISYSRFERNDSVTVLGADGSLVPFDYEITNSSLRPAYSYDSRDSSIEPTVGTRFVTSIEYAGGVLGGNNEFLRPQFSLTRYQPLSELPIQTVLGFNLEAGWLEPINDAALAPLERFFLGGEQTVRGFEFRDLTVRCEGGEPYPGRVEPCQENERLIDSRGALLGGERFVQLNLEYHLILGGPFRLIGFFDAANVFSPDQTIDLGRLRQSAGVEARIYVPVLGAPLRFIWSRNLDPLDGDRFQSFQFSIGSTF